MSGVALGLDVSRPTGNDNGIRAGLERSAVLLQTLVTVGDPPLCVFRARDGSVTRLARCGEDGAGLVDVVRIEGRSEPLIERPDDGLLAGVGDAHRVLDRAGSGAAPIVGLAVGPGAFHAPAALSTEDQRGQHVVPLIPRLADDLLPATACSRALFLGGGER